MVEARILYSEPLIQGFERAMRTSYDPEYLQLTRKPLRCRGRFNVVISGGPRQFHAGDTEAAHDVVEIRREGIPRGTFWVGFKAAFDIWEGYSSLLEHVSVTLCQSIPTGELLGMFRAEWDSRGATDSTSNHAQPHWHITLGPDAFRVLREPPDSGSRAPVEFSPENVSDGLGIDISSFHFAMSPLWSRGVTAPHRQRFETTEELGAWFNSLSTYIAEQLAYVTKKTGIAQGAIVDFR